MKTIKEGYFEGERALYNISDTEIINSTFDNGESPLKECKNIKIKDSSFKYKYPLWYCNGVECDNVTFIEMSRSGIWYTKDITIKNSLIASLKQFRRSENITLDNVSIPNAQETLWNCKNIKMNNISSSGDYFGMNSEGIYVNNWNHSGNYLFDGAKNIEIHNAKLDSKDSFWNTEDVVVYDSTIIGEYLGWNSKNLTFINCVIDSKQGMCYIDNIKLVNCKLLNTNLAFERVNNVDADIHSKIDSIKNPYSGIIYARKIDEIILDEDIVDKNKTKIIVEEK